MLQLEKENEDLRRAAFAVSAHHDPVKTSEAELQRLQQVRVCVCARVAVMRVRVQVVGRAVACDAVACDAVACDHVHVMQVCVFVLRVRHQPV